MHELDYTWSCWKNIAKEIYGYVYKLGSNKFEIYADECGMPDHGCKILASMK